MLKTFNVVEKYERILSFLETKKNQSSYICELILKDMQGEQLEANMEELKQSVSTEITEGIVKLKDAIQTEIKRGFREEIREEIRSEIRSEVRGEMRDLRRFLTEQFAEITMIQTKNPQGTVAYATPVPWGTVTSQPEAKEKEVPDLKDLKLTI